MNEPTPPPLPGLEDLSALGNVAERYEILKGAAQRLAVAYYQNFVLTVYDGLRRQPTDRFARLVAEESPVLDHRLVHSGPPRDAAVLWAIAKAWQTRDHSHLTETEVDVLLRARIETADPSPFASYLQGHLGMRGGYPRQRAQRWLGNVERTRILLETVAAGTYLDFAFEGRTPEELRTRLGELALNVERSIKLRTIRQRAADAAEKQHAAAILHWEVAESTDRAQIRQQIKRLHAAAQAAHKAAAQAGQAVQDTVSDFYSALGPNTSPPRSGRGRQR